MIITRGILFGLLLFSTVHLGAMEAEGNVVLDNIKARIVVAIWGDDAGVLQDCMNQLQAIGQQETLSINDDGETVFHYAVYLNAPACRDYIAQEFEGNLNNFVNAQRNDGRTPLHSAVAVHSIDSVRYLLEHHADVLMQAQDSSTPLTIALQEACLQNPHPDCVEIIRELVDHGADNQEHRSEQVIELLNNLDVSIRDEVWEIFHINPE